jgi:hypothetical protein
MQSWGTQALLLAVFRCEARGDHAEKCTNTPGSEAAQSSNARSTAYRATCGPSKSTLFRSERWTARRRTVHADTGDDYQVLDKHLTFQQRDPQLNHQPRAQHRSHALVMILRGWARPSSQSSGGGISGCTPSTDSGQGMAGGGAAAHRGHRVTPGNAPE